jgi:glucose/arabinose dehydrogenase
MQTSPFWFAGRYWGRPVDVAVAPDGSLLVSDDKAGMVYKIQYVGSARS